MVGRITEHGPNRKVKNLGNGQTLKTSMGKDSSDSMYSSTKMGGGMNNFSHSVPGNSKPKGSTK